MGSSSPSWCGRSAFVIVMLAGRFPGLVGGCVTGIAGAVVGVLFAVAYGVRRKTTPNGERIFLALIDLGDGGEPRQVVFGGKTPLVRGQFVAAAPPGSRLHNGVKMRRRRYWGESSHGMLCSTIELGWVKEGPDEVAVLRPDNIPGKSLDYVQCWDQMLDEARTKSRIAFLVWQPLFVT